MKKLTLIAIVSLVMLSSCGMHHCPTYSMQRGTKQGHKAQHKFTKHRNGKKAALLI